MSAVDNSDIDCSHEDIRSVLNLSDPEDNEVDESTEQEDRDVLRQDNEDLYRWKRKMYEILTIAMCCLFLFSTSYSKATPKDMQKKLPSVQEKFEKAGEALIYDMGFDELGAKLVSAIAMIDLPAIFISPVTALSFPSDFACIPNHRFPCFTNTQFAGYCVTRWDSKITLIAIMVFCFSGSLLCSLSIWNGIWWWFPVGRVVFGLGVASLVWNNLCSLSIPFQTPCSFI